MLAQGPAYMLEGGGGGDEGAASQGHISDLKKKKKKSGCAQTGPEIQNKTAEVM